MYIFGLIGIPAISRHFLNRSKSGDISKHKIWVAGVHHSDRVVANSTADSSVRVSFETTLALVRMSLFGNPHCAKAFIFEIHRHVDVIKEFRSRLRRSHLIYYFQMECHARMLFCSREWRLLRNLVVQWPSVSKSLIRTVILINN